MKGNAWPYSDWDQRPPSRGRWIQPPALMGAADRFFENPARPLVVDDWAGPGHGHGDRGGWDIHSKEGRKELEAHD